MHLTQRDWAPLVRNMVGLHFMNKWGQQNVGPIAVAACVCVMAGCIGWLISHAGSHISLLTIAVSAAVLAVGAVAYRSMKSNRIEWARSGSVLVDRKLSLFQAVSLLFLCIGVITSSWNGLRAGAGLALCDVFFVLAAASWAVSTAFGRPQVVVWPKWLVVPAYLLLVDVLVSSIATEEGAKSLLFGCRFVVALLLTPMVIGVIAGNFRALWLVVDCWLFSAAVNAAVAVTDYFGHAHIEQSLTGVKVYGRVAGLTTQPNHLGFVCVFALPILLTRLLQTRSGSLRIMYVGIMVLCTLGLLASGSRGGVVGGLFVFVSAPFFQPAIRGRLSMVLASGVIIALLIAVFVPSTSSIVSIQRLTGSSSAQPGAGVELSDINRAVRREVAIEEFDSSPIYGTGFAVVRETEDIYLQLLSAGGVVALLAWLAFISGASVSSFRVGRMKSVSPELQGLAGAVCGTLVAWALMGIVENQLYDRYLFVPCGLLIGCLVTIRGNAFIVNRTSNELIATSAASRRQWLPTA